MKIFSIATILGLLILTPLNAHTGNAHAEKGIVRVAAEFPSLNKVKAICQQINESHFAMSKSCSAMCATEGKDLAVVPQCMKDISNPHKFHMAKSTIRKACNSSCKHTTCGTSGNMKKRKAKCKAWCCSILGNDGLKRCLGKERCPE